MTSKQEVPAVLGPVERQVRPCVWMVRSHGAPAYWIPFLHEPVDALKDTEREVVRLHWPEELAAERERVNALLAAIREHWIKANGEDSLSVSALDVIAGVIADGSYVLGPNVANNRPAAVGGSG